MTVCRPLGSAILLALLAGCAAPSVQSGFDVPLEARADPVNWPAASSPSAISDPQTEARIDALLSRLTLEQKVGQLVQADLSAIAPGDLAKYPLGSILAGGNSGPYGNERSTAADWHRLVLEFRDASLSYPAGGTAIPIIFGVDAVHGHNNIPGATIFPHNIGLGAANDPDLIKRIGAATAAEIAASGIEWTFAPTLAVPQDLRWGRTYEGYSSNPDLVARYGAAMVEGLQGELRPGEPLAANKVAATAKHFLADGGTAQGRDQGDAAIDESELVRVHAAGYPPAIEAGALTVMASFSSWNGVKHHGNPTLLTDVLKDRMGFEGFVVGDWNGHGQVAGCSVTDCVRSVQAGLDMYMAPDSWKGLYENLLRQARSGELPRERLDDAVRRILRVKFKLGLLDGRRGELNSSAIGAPDHLALAREAVAKSLVLLKNNGSVLPIKPGARVLVAGPGADDMAMQSGGWTVSWQGRDVTKEDFPNGQTLWQALSQAVTEAGGAAELSPSGDFSQRPDVAIVVYGEPPYAEMQGDLPTLDYQPAGDADLALLKSLRGQGIPVVSVFLSGRPLFTNPEINASDAFVAAWLPGTQANGLADVLVARSGGRAVRDFTGRLPFAWPSDATGDLGDPLFPVGYGLDYSSSASLGVLSEDPRVDMASAINLSRLFDGGTARSPWGLSIADAGGERPVTGSIVTSPGGALVARSVDVRRQEDGKALAWTGPATLILSRPRADFSAHVAGGALKLTGLVTAAPQVPVTVSFGGAALDLAAMLRAAGPGISEIAVPLRCFARAGGNLGDVDGLRMAATGGFSFTLLSAEVGPAESSAACPEAAG